MVNLKSNFLLWKSLAQAIELDHRDIMTVERRYKSEGLTFLTKTLPTFGKSLMSTVINGEKYVCPPNFRLGTDGFPLFLRSLTIEILDEDGYLRDIKIETVARSIQLVQQLTLLFYKMKVDYESSIDNKYLDNFIKVDQELPSKIRARGVKAPIIKEAKKLLKKLFCNFDPYDIVGYHGSGATACRTKSEDKYHNLNYDPRMDRYFHYDKLFFYNEEDLSSRLDSLLKASPVQQTSRLTAVPKDSRGPRLICMEPRERMYVQLGIMSKMYKYIESHVITRGRVNFTDQTINQALIKKASIDKDYATLDLSEASDRVSLALVRKIFPKRIYEALVACRTEYVKLPDDQIVKLKKVAPMGNALCFPIEAICFFVLLRASGIHDVYVYGDDIVLPTGCFDKAIAVLEAFNLKINTDKSCALTNYRESCGKEFYCGIDVGYVKLRKPLDNIGTKYSSEDLSSFIEFRNLCYESYPEMDISILDNFFHEHLGPIPYTMLDVPLTFKGRNVKFNVEYFDSRYNEHLQHTQFRIRTPQVRKNRRRTKVQHHRCELLRHFVQKSRVFYGRTLSKEWYQGSASAEPIGSYASSLRTPKMKWKSL